jgi:hypothetical protein
MIFDSVLENPAFLSIRPFAEFLTYFPGMTCDFSDAERERFSRAIKKKHF